MTTVYDIVRFMESIAPQSKKESWDNVGLLCGRRDKQVTAILVALDPFEDVAEEAVKLGADLIVTHHPLIFHPLYSLTDDTAIGRTAATLLRHDIAAFSAHTNLDIAPQGVGACLGTIAHGDCCPSTVGNLPAPCEAAAPHTGCAIRPCLRKGSPGCGGRRRLCGRMEKRFRGEMRYLCHCRCQIQRFLGCPGRGTDAD